jgi:hypothetical protein
MEAQIIGGLGHQRIECHITGKARAVQRCRLSPKYNSG